MNLTSNWAIDVENLEFTYSQQSAPTLKIRKLQVRKGESFFLFGPSGTGKTTFLEIIAGVLQAQKGTVQVAEHSLEKLSKTELDHFRARHIGYIFQSFNLIPYLTVQENILLPYLLHSFLQQKSQVDLQKLLKDLVSKLGIDNIMSEKVTRISVGQQQRVAVARALLTRPDVILADEPTSSLDMDHREKFLKVLFELSHEIGSTILFVSHDRTIEKLFTRSASLLELKSL